MKILTYLCSNGTLTVPEQFVGENEVTSLVVDYTGVGVDSWQKGIVVMPYGLEGFPVLLGTNVVESVLIPVGWLWKGRLTIQPYAVSPTEQVMRFPVRTAPVGLSLSRRGLEEVLTSSVLEGIEAQFTEKVDKLMATNLVTNGDFSNGTTGWSGVGASISNVGGRLQITPTTEFGGARQAFSLLANNRYYLKTQIDAPLSHYMIMLGIGASIISNNVAGVSNLGIVFTAPTTESVTLNIGTTLASNFVSFFADFVVLIDLTTTFGAGNEPTKEQMDYLLSNFPNSWFNGTQELINYRQLFDRVLELDTEKANTVHTHVRADINDFAHAHPISEVVNLQTALDGKVDETTTINNQALSTNIIINASDVPNTPAGNISATNVQNAINELDTEKVDKIIGKGLSTEDYTTAEKAKVANLPLDTNAQLAEITSTLTVENQEWSVI